MSKFYRSTEELIGKTPLVALLRAEEKFALKAKLFAKAEYFNPTGSVKDRAAKGMLDEAERTGALKKGGTVIEPTSGNTGIGLAFLCLLRGYKAIIVMPDSMSVERQQLMKAYGAEVVLTDGKKGMKGAIEKAEQLAKEIPDSFIPDQFKNPANAEIHYRTTGKEIYEDLEGEVDIFVAGVGTGGTITGVGRYLKEKNPCVKIVGVEPQSSPVLSKSEAGVHKIQGIGAGFVPAVLDQSVLDEVIAVSDSEAFTGAKELATTEGLFVGISSGAAYCAARALAAKRENEGKKIVVLLPDGGSRYLSTLTEKE